MDIQFELPASAVDIFNDLIEIEYKASAIKVQMGVELLYLGFKEASRHYYDESRSELDHAQKLTDFLISRGVKSEPPKLEVKKLGIVDLSSAIKDSYRLEIEVTKAYDEAIREMIKIDIMAFNILQEMMTIQKGEIESARQAYMTFEYLKVEDQRQMEVGYFSGPQPISEPN